MKATRPNQERRRGRSSSPEASRRGQRPLARYLTPGLPRRLAPCGVNFPPAEGGRTPRTLEHPSSSGSCHRRPAPGPPRSIHNLRPRRLQPVALPPGSRRLRRGAAQGRAAGPRPLRTATSPPPRKQQCTTGAGWGPHAARRRRRPPAARPPRAPPHTRPLAPTAAARARPGGQRPPAAPVRRAAATAESTGSRHTRRHPPCSRRPAAGRCGDAGRAAGPSRRHPAAPQGRPAPRPRPRPSGRYSREITAQRVG